VALGLAVLEGLADLLPSLPSPPSPPSADLVALGLAVLEGLADLLPSLPSPPSPPSADLVALGLAVLEGLVLALALGDGDLGLGVALGLLFFDLGFSGADLLGSVPPSLALGLSALGATTLAEGVTLGVVVLSLLQATRPAPRLSVRNRLMALEVMWMDGKYYYLLKFIYINIACRYQ
jgi:hypothetical protein